LEQQAESTKQLNETMRQLTDTLRTPREAAPEATGPMSDQLGIKDIVVPPAAQPQPIIVPSEPAAPAVAPFVDRFGKWPATPAPIILPPTEAPPSAAAPRAAFSAEQATPSAFAGRPIDLAGGGSAPWKAGGELGQQQTNLMDVASAGSALDRASEREVNVNGTGQINVDFKNMPRGVTGQAEGGGLFRKTEISRHVQMEPAASGPVVPAGAVMAG
jgi:hypothetical protein